MPVRKVSNRGGNIIGKFPSIKIGRMIAFESLIERDFIYLLDYEKEIEWFEEQPLTIEYKYEGKNLHYTPDFHLVEKGQNVLVECKPEKFVIREENQRKKIAAVNWCLQHNWEYRVVTEREIREGFRLENIKLLTRYARQVISSNIKACIYALVNNNCNQLSIEKITKAISPQNPSVIFISILHMAFHHEICLPLDNAPISERSEVFFRLGKQKEQKV